MTRRSRRASSSPQRVGSDEGLTSARPRVPAAAWGEQDRGAEDPTPAAEGIDGSSPKAAAAERTPVEQTSDDTDEGWGERGEDDTSARWLRENRPPHWS